MNMPRSPILNPSSVKKNIIDYTLINAGNSSETNTSMYTINAHVTEVFSTFASFPCMQPARVAETSGISVPEKTVYSRPHSSNT